MQESYDFPRSSSLSNGSAATSALLNDFNYASDWRKASGTQGSSFDWRSQSYGQNGYNGYQRRNYKTRTREIDLSPLLDVLKRIDEIDTSMEGKRKTRIKDVSDSHNSLSDNSIISSNDGSNLKIYDKDFSPVKRYLNGNNYIEDIQGNRNTDRHRSPGLRKHLTVPNLKSDLDTMDDVSNISDEEFIPESLTPEDTHNNGNGTPDKTGDSNDTLDVNDEQADDSFGDVYRENVKHIINNPHDSSVELETDRSGKSTEKDTKIDKVENGYKFKKNRNSSVGFNMDHLNVPNKIREREEMDNVDSDMDKSGYVTEDDFEQLCTDIDEPFSDDDDDDDKTDEAEDDSSDTSVDSVDEELGWRSRGYNNDFFISRKSVVGSEIINCYNKARSRHSSKHSSRSSGSCTPKISGSDSDRATPLAKPSKLFHTNNSAPITRHGSNASFEGMNQAKVSRKSEPIVRVGSAGHLSDIADRFRTKNIVEASEEIDDRTLIQKEKSDSCEGILKGGSGGVRVAELKAALEREIEKAKTS